MPSVCIMSAFCLEHPAMPVGGGTDQRYCLRWRKCSSVGETLLTVFPFSLLPGKFHEGWGTEKAWDVVLCQQQDTQRF